MNVMDASELYDPEFRNLIKRAHDLGTSPTVIIPIGSLEQHGAHLPITTDSDIVTEIASRLGKKCDFIVLPTISYGVSGEHHPLTNISINEALVTMFYEIMSTLGKMSNQDEHPRYEGLCIILNGHHGNVEALSSVEEMFAESYGDLQVVSDTPYKPLSVIEKEEVGTETAKSTVGNVRVYSYWKFMKHEFDHAGFVETSIMLAISDKVKMKEAKKGLSLNGKTKREIERIKKLSTKPGGFAKVTWNGVWGDPTGATKKDGEKFLAEIVRNLAKECQT